MPNQVGGWSDADHSEDIHGRFWCQYDTPFEEKSCTVGSPVQPGTGREALTETDYSGAGAHPLNVSRQYRSFWAEGVNAGLTPATEMQGGWMLSIQTRVSDLLPGRLQPTRRVTRPSGELVTFYGTASNRTAVVWTSYDGSGDQLIEQRDATGKLTGWQYRVGADDSMESYDAAGLLVSIVQRNRWTTTLTYSTAATPLATYITGGGNPQPGRLISVRNQFGRQYQLVYDPQGRIVQLLPPGAVKDANPGGFNSPIRYRYEERATLGAATPSRNQLTSVQWQDGTIKRYHYEDSQLPLALTGTTDELGTRIVTRSYDPQGRVVEEFGAGGVDRLQFTYLTDGGWSTGHQTFVTDSSGVGGATTTRRFTFQNTRGVMRPTSISAPCAQCGNTQANTLYNANGKPLKTIGHDGQVTYFSYDSAGRETERAVFLSSYQNTTTRPALANATQVTTTQWHARFNLPLQIAEPSQLTVYVYDAVGNLTGQSRAATNDATGATQFTAIAVGSVASTGWSYDLAGLNTAIVEKTGASETGRWTLSYDALGNVINITDGINLRAATLRSYDAHGRLTAGMTDMGLVMQFTYAPRGFVSSKTVNNQTITYTQNAVGLTTQVRLPGAQTLTYIYDATHRLTDTQLNGAAFTPAMLAAGDYPDGFLKARWAQLMKGVQEGLTELLPTAWAQAVGRFLMPVPVLPGQPMPGQPELDPRTDMLMVAPMSPADKAQRRLAEQLARSCECKPSNGYTTPTFTSVTYAHLLFGGHLSPLFSDKSYFSNNEKVGQAFVNEAISKQIFFDKAGFREIYEANFGRVIGFYRDKTSPSGFTPTMKARLIIEKNNCTSKFFAANEVVTIYPVK